MNELLKFILNFVPRPWLIRLSFWVKPLLIIYYRGNQFVDPIDGKKFRKFLPYGYGKSRANALSPSTLSLERHRLMWLYLKRETDFFSKPLKILHMAPEQSFYKKFKALKNLDYTTADLHSPLADVKANLLHLPFDDETFDVIFCNHVLEHIEDDIRAMQELYRVMKKGGWGILQVPMKSDLEKTYEDFTIQSPEERKKHFGQYDHVRWYGMDYFQRLEDVGFNVTKDFGSHQFTEEEQKKYALMKGEVLPIVRKSV